MAKNKIVIAELDVNTQALIESATATAKQIENLKEQQSKLISKGKEASQEFVANAAALKSLQATYKSQQAAISAQIAEDGKLLSMKKAVKEAVNQVNDSENDYLQNNRELIALKKQLKTSDEDYEKRLAKINSKLSENNQWLQQNGSEHGKLINTVSDYKNQISEGLNSLNVFNGGLKGVG